MRPTNFGIVGSVHALADKVSVIALLLFLHIHGTQHDASTNALGDCADCDSFRAYIRDNGIVVKDDELRLQCHPETGVQSLLKVQASLSGLAESPNGGTR